MYWVLEKGGGSKTKEKRGAQGKKKTKKKNIRWDNRKSSSRNEKVQKTEKAGGHECCLLGDKKKEKPQGKVDSVGEKKKRNRIKKGLLKTQYGAVNIDQDGADGRTKYTRHRRLGKKSQKFDAQDTKG